jgi:hypothetical protein
MAPAFLDKVARDRLKQFGQLIKGDDGDFGTGSRDWRMPPARIANLVSHGLARIEKIGNSTFAIWVGPKE